MTILPTLAEAREIASSAAYNVLPVSCEMLSDFTTPIETMRILKNVSTHCYIYGVQFHPESIMTPDGKTMLKNFINL